MANSSELLILARSCHNGSAQPVLLADIFLACPSAHALGQLEAVRATGTGIFEVVCWTPRSTVLCGVMMMSKKVCYSSCVNQLRRSRTLIRWKGLNCSGTVGSMSSPVLHDEKGHGLMRR